MEIRDPVHGAMEISDAEASVLDSLAYQRLRQIKQLGFSEFSFPGATHNRYLHSLGATLLADQVFSSVFKDYKFSSKKVSRRFRQALKLAVMLHDIGHGPLSHTTESVMPPLKKLKVNVYKRRRQDINIPEKILLTDRQANHEDYTIKFITDSSLTKILRENFPDISPIHIACLIDKTLECPDDFFHDGVIDFRTVLSQIVSSEIDADRMDYLERDSYFTGTKYGNIESEWLITNFTFHLKNDQAYLALNRRALYAFDDFLLARHHMNLMVYFHHKAVIYEELLQRYLTSKDCTFYLPSDIEDYIGCTDYALYQHLASVQNEWARRITERRTFRVVFEIHLVDSNDRTRKIQKALEAEGIAVIFASSSVRLSKYHSASSVERNFPIFVVDQYDRGAKPYPIENQTKIFQRYDEIRRIERLYVKPEQFSDAEKLISSRKL